ncbi:very large A-kinase anchor protein isoform X2 [Melanerpes formicivorus]|uniref:very large A-kinase anchor protein isoform X2 n=1 Tax=Melanerpes formicivorus TaxID=211600 RepID=UPI00358DDEE7
MSGGGSRRQSGPSWHSTFSRFFSRSPPGEGTVVPGRPAGANSSENKGREAINLRGNQKESTTQPALLKVYQNEEKNHSTGELDKSEIQEELKKANSLPSLSPAVRTADKQPREGFFHFLGSLFNIATKSSLVESKPASTFKYECNRSEKDLQNRNTLDMQPKHPKIEEPVSSAAEIQEDCVNKADAILNSTEKEISQDLQGGRKPPTDAQKRMQHKPEAPAVTYATYRGSARIRQLLKNQLERDEKREENTENRNAAMVKENGEIQTPVSSQSGCLIKTNGVNGSKGHEDDATLNPSAVKMGRKKCGEAWHFPGSSKHEITVKATTSSTESSQEMDLNCMPALATAKVKRTYSLDSLLSSTSRNSDILTSSTSQITNSLKMRSANDLFGKDNGLLGEAETLFQADTNATCNFIKENNNSKTANQESMKEMQDGCLHSPKSKSKTVNEELQVSTHQMASNLEIPVDVHVLQSNTTAFKQQVDQHKDSADEDSNTQKIVADVGGEENAQNFLAAILLPPSHSMESGRGKHIATGNQTIMASSVNEGVVMEKGTCNKDLSVLGEPMHIQNDHKLIHVENCRDTATQQSDLLSLETASSETSQSSAEVAVENLAHVSCTQVCGTLKSDFDEPTAARSVTDESSETRSCCSASLHSSLEFKNKALGKREVSLPGKRESLSSPGLEYKKSKSFEPAEMSLSENPTPVHNHCPVSLETVQDAGAKALVIHAEDNTTKPALCPLITTDRTGNCTPAASEIDKTGMSEVALLSEHEDCIFELFSHISELQEKSLEVSHSALRCGGRHLMNHSAFICEKNVDADIISESLPVSEDSYTNFSSTKENSNNPGISPTVLDSSSGNKGKMHSPPTDSENGHIAGWSAASEQDSFIFAAVESSMIIPEDKMTVPLCLGDPSTLCPASSLESEHTPAMLDSSVAEVDSRGVSIPSPTSATLESREASNLSICDLEMLGFAQGNYSSPSHTVSDGAEEAYSRQQAGNNVVAEAMPPPICPLKILEMASKSACTVRMCRNAGGQVILDNHVSATSETPSVMDDQTAAVPTKSNDLCSEELWKGISVKGQEHADGLFKKAEEIVDSVLHLAIEEIIAEHTIGVPCLYGSKDSLISTDIRNDQKAETVPLEAEEIQSAGQSTQHLHEVSGGGSSSLTRTVDANNQEEKIVSYTPDKIDLHSALALKAKETIDKVINSAKQELASHQWQGSESQRPSEKVEPKPRAETPEYFNSDMKLPAKTQEPAEKEETRSVTINCDQADCSGPPFLLNSRENGIDWPQQGEKIPNNAFACQTNGFLSTGSSARPESDLMPSAKEQHNRKVCDHLAAAEMCGKDGLSATSRKSDGSSHLVQKDATVTEEMILSLHLKCSCSSTNTLEHTLLPTVNVNLSSFMPGEECISMQGESPDKSSPQGSLENSAQDGLCEHCGKEAAEVPAQVKAPLDDSKRVESKEEPAEGASEVADTNVGLNTQFIVPELSVIGEDSEGKNCFNTDLAQNNENLKQVQKKDQDMKRKNQLEENGLDFVNDMNESAAALAFSPLTEQWENSSFTIVYEGALQTESRSVSTDDMQRGLLSSSDLPADNIDHLMYERAKNKPEPVCLYEMGNKLSEATDSHSSKSFLSVEAKRYRVYPFSLSPIYEDDSSQEDILSTGMSPEGCPSGKPKDNSDHASVLSLLQSVSERLQFTTQFNKEEEEEGVEEEEDEEESSYEENILERENDCISSQWRGNSKATLHSNNNNRYLFPEQSLFHSKEQPDSKEQLEPFADAASPSHTLCKPVSQKDDAALKHPPASVYYQYLKSTNNCSSEKRTRFGSLLQDMLQPKIHWSQDTTIPKLEQLSKNLVDRTSLRYNPRPGKMIIYDICGDKSKQEVHSDVLDATSWIFHVGTFLRIIRGCWILYEKPKFRGRKYVLEEGEAVLDHLWDLPGMKHHQRNLTVGSIKHVTKDCGVPEVEFCLAAGGTEGLPICIQSAAANLEELDVEKNPYIRVKSGVWLAYSDCNYKGDVKVLEECGSPSEIPSADVKSLRPLKMGGLKVQMPMNVKMGCL